jgi:hypothetical protein
MLTFTLELNEGKPVATTLLHVPEGEGVAWP